MNSIQLSLVLMIILTIPGFARSATTKKEKCTFFSAGRLSKNVLLVNSDFKVFDIAPHQLTEKHITLGAPVDFGVKWPVMVEQIGVLSRNFYPVATIRMNDTQEYLLVRRLPNVGKNTSIVTMHRINSDKTTDSVQLKFIDDATPKYWISSIEEQTFYQLNSNGTSLSKYNILSGSNVVSLNTTFKICVGKNANSIFLDTNATISCTPPDLKLGKSFTGFTDKKHFYFFGDSNVYVFKYMDKPVETALTKVANKKFFAGCKSGASTTTAAGLFLLVAGLAILWALF